MKSTYRVLKENVNPYESIIEGVVKEKEWKSHFTIGDIERDMVKLSKLKQELEGKKTVEEAKIQNVKNQHPEIDLDIDEKIQIAYTIVQTAKTYINECEKKVKAIEEQMNIYAEDLKDVLEQTKIKLPDENDKK